MIKILVDPTADHALDIGKIHHHAAAIKLGRLDHNHGPPVVPVQKAAFPVVVEKAMAVAKIDLSGNAEHVVSGRWPVVRRWTATYILRSFRFIRYGFRHGQSIAGCCSLDSNLSVSGLRQGGFAEDLSARRTDPRGDRRP
jgi:hypothetical protein